MTLTLNVVLPCFICLISRTGVFRCATIEEIEAEKSMIEKDVVRTPDNLFIA